MVSQHPLMHFYLYKLLLSINICSLCSLHTQHVNVGEKRRSKILPSQFDETPLKSGGSHDATKPNLATGVETEDAPILCHASSMQIIEQSRLLIDHLESEKGSGNLKGNILSWHPKDLIANYSSQAFGANDLIFIHHTPCLFLFRFYLISLSIGGDIKKRIQSHNILWWCENIASSRTVMGWGSGGNASKGLAAVC